LITITLLTILFIISNPIYSEEIEIRGKSNVFERNLALKYCDAINKSIFKGLEKESILKYVYFFSSIKRQNINNSEKFLNKFSLEVEKMCFYKLSKSDREEFKKYIDKYNRR